MLGLKYSILGFWAEFSGDFISQERSIVDVGNLSLAFFIYNSLIRAPNSVSFPFIFHFFREFTSSFFGAKKRSCVADKATASAPFQRRFLLRLSKVCSADLAKGNMC